MGYNRPERERIRRGQRRPLGKERFRDVTSKRFRHHLGKRLPHLAETALDPLVTAWVTLTDYDLDLAQRWWDLGVDPGMPSPLINAIKEGLRIEHLRRVIDGRTVAEHLHQGNSLRWCLGAMGMSTSVDNDIESRHSA